MRSFKVIREKDSTGISGIGTVIEGTTFSDGTCVIRWSTDRAPHSTAIFTTFEEFYAIHIEKHPENNTQVVWSEEF